jgi:amidase
MEDVIGFNLDHANQELLWFGQEWFELAQAEIFSEQEYQEALVRGPKLAGEDGIDAILALENLDALVAPTGSPSWPIDLVNGDHFLGASSGPAAVAGYPVVNVPMGYAFGLPVGISFMGSSFSEPTLIKLASGFEAATHHRRAPTFVPTLPLPTGTGNAFNGGSMAPLRAKAEALRRRLDAAPLAVRRRFSGLL